MSTCKEREERRWPQRTHPQNESVQLGVERGIRRKVVVNTLAWAKKSHMVRFEAPPTRQLRAAAREQRCYTRLHVADRLLCARQDEWN